MPSFRDAIGKKAKSIACWIADNGDRQDEIWGEATKDNPFVTIGQGSPLFSPYPLARLICGDEPAPDNPPDFGPYPTQFEGGQCPVDYRISCVATRYFNGQLASERDELIGGQFFRGPIEEVFLTAGNQDIWVRHNNGQESDLQSGDPSNVTYGDLREVVVTRVDGQPDNCGNLPPEQPGIEPEPDEICYDGPNGEICEPITIQPRTPRRDNNGDIIIPFNFDIGLGPFNVDFNLSTGNINIGGGGGGGSNGDGNPCCKKPNLDDTPDNPDLPGTPPPQDPENDREFVGVIVTATDIRPNAKATVLTGGPDVNLYIPRLATISFAVKLGESRAWTDDIPVRKQRQYIEYQGVGTAYRYNIYPEPGFTVQVEPIYAAE